MEKKSETIIDMNAREGTGSKMTTIALGRRDDITSCRKSMMIHMATLRIALRRMCRRDWDPQQ